jgi:hypothetical protein
MFLSFFGVNAPLLPDWRTELPKPYNPQRTMIGAAKVNYFSKSAKGKLPI